MKKLTMVGLLILFVSCNGDGYDCCAHMATGMEISVKNQNGEDLLDPNNPGAYRENDIKLFYKIGEELEEVNNPNMNSPKGFWIFWHANEYRIGLSLNHAQTEPQPVTYIQWSETDTDTIKAEFRYPGQSVILEKVWFNGELKEPYIELVK